MYIFLSTSHFLAILCFVSILTLKLPKIKGHIKAPGAGKVPQMQRLLPAVPTHRRRDLFGLVFNFQRIYGDLQTFVNF